MSLNNKTILVTRRPEQAGRFIAEVERRGGRAIVVPAIRVIDPDSWDPCDEAISRLVFYDAVLLTSVNAVQKFMGRCRQRGIGTAALRQVTFRALGAKTAAAIAGEGCDTGTLPPAYSGASFAETLIAEGVAGKRFLLPRSEIGGRELAEELERHGARVDSVVCYRTVPPEPRDARPLVRQLLDGGVDVLAFASPSAVQNFLAMLPESARDAVRARTAVAVIGPTTGRAASELGWPPAIVAESATDEGFVEAIDEYFSRNR